MKKIFSTIFGFLLICVLIFTSGCSDQAIEDVLEQDSQATYGVSSVEAYIKVLQSIDLSKCPSDFRSAFSSHISAWCLMGDLERQARALDTATGLLGSGGGNPGWDLLVGLAGACVSADLQDQYSSAEAKIYNTYNEVLRIARKHGVDTKKYEEE